MITRMQIRSNGWRHYWGEMPLPDGAEGIGVVSTESGIGALIRLRNGVYVQGNAGGLRMLHQQVVRKCLDEMDDRP
jgi:hypothetical protein